MSTTQTPPAPGTELAKKSTELFGLLKKYEKQIEASIPKHFTVETMLRLVVGAVNKNPALLTCSSGSVLNSVMYLAQVGLQPRVNEAYLIPYKGVCTPVIDYRGKIKLARQSGLVKDIEPHLVYAADKFDLKWSTDPSKRGLVHEPLLFTREKDTGLMQRIEDKQRGLPILGYAIGWLTDADPHTEVMTFADIEWIRSKSPSAQKGPWVTDWDQMALKTLVHRLCKMLPQSAEMQMAQELDDRNDMGLSIDPIIELNADDDKIIGEGRIRNFQGEGEGTNSLKDRVKTAADQQKAASGEPDAPAQETFKPAAQVSEESLKVYTPDTIPDAMAMTPGARCILGVNILEAVESNGVTDWKVVGAAPKVKGKKD